MDEFNFFFLILKTFINFVDLINLSLFFLFIIIISYFYNYNNIRKKFLFFIFIFCILSFIGLSYNLDGVVMLFCISELSIILIFIILYSQLFSYNNKYKNYSLISIVIVFLLFINFKYYELTTLQYSNFYVITANHINDFYYIFNCYFEKHIIMTILIIFIITIYSVVFILFYFNLKKYSNIEFLKKKNINLLRKQNLFNQVNSKLKIRNFSN